MMSHNTHVHGQDAAGDELSVLPDGKVPRLDPHQIIKGELQYQTTLRTNLEKDHMVTVTFLLSLISLSVIFNCLAGSGDKKGISVYWPYVVFMDVDLCFGVCSRTLSELFCSQYLQCSLPSFKASVCGPLSHPAISKM